MNNNGKNNDPLVALKDIPEELKKDFDEKGHLRMTDEQRELQSIVDKSLEECGGRGSLSAYQRVWLRKSLEEHIDKKYGDVKEPVLPQGTVTDKEKAEFMVEKVVWELRKMRQAAKGALSKDFMDMERKARKLLNVFGQSLPDNPDCNLLLDITALFMEMMFKEGKWSK